MGQDQILSGDAALDLGPKPSQPSTAPDDSRNGAAADAEKTLAIQEVACPSNDDDDHHATALFVDFDGPDDAADPRNWSKRHKWTIVALLSVANTVTNLATVLCIPSAPQILAALHSPNPLYATLLVSIWELGEAVGPLLTAPLSELYGRAPVYHGANVVFTLFSAACALSTNLPMLVAFRFVNGMGDAAIALNPSIVGDMFGERERGLAIAVVGLPPLIGPVAGPVVGGYLTQAEGWRWAFWISAVMGAVCEVGFLALFRETYRPRILQRKAGQVRKRTGDRGIRCRYDDDVERGRAVVFRRALVRPVQMLWQSPIVLMFAVYISFVYGVCYILLTTLTGIFEEYYGFSQGAAGLAYLGLSLGMVAGVLLCAGTSDWYVKRQRRRHGATKPEHRLPPMVLGGILIPLGLLVYGWSAAHRVFYVVPMLGTATLGFGFFVTTIPLSAYLVDAYPVHAASAIAATIVLRSVVGALLPLAGPPLYAGLGLGWGNSLVALVALLFLPVPMLFMRFGERIRKRSSLVVVD